jgi:ParB family chromosome partitioning protein
LPNKIKQALREGIISRSQARTILGVEKPLAQEKLFHQILKQGLSVRDIEKKARSSSSRRRATDPFVLELEQKVQRRLGTKVKIFNKKNNSGRIVIEYYNLSDLERIIGRLR